MFNLHRLIVIQGPPGTGKTETIAELTRLSRLKYECVGLFAHSNIGVDTALQRCDLKNACRIGTSHADQLRDISTKHIGDDRLSKEHPGLDRSACLK